jgi:acetolactate synthase-1/2/3 large subunit
MCGFERADLVICIGFDHVEYSPRFWNPDGSKKIIHIHSHHHEIDEKIYPGPFTDRKYSHCSETINTLL